MNCTYCGHHSQNGEYLCTECAEGLEREFQEFQLEKSSMVGITDTSVYQEEEWDDSIPF